METGPVQVEPLAGVLRVTWGPRRRSVSTGTSAAAAWKRAAQPRSLQPGRLAGTTGEPPAAGLILSPGPGAGAGAGPGPWTSRAAWRRVCAGQKPCSWWTAPVGRRSPIPHRDAPQCVCALVLRVKTDCFLLGVWQKAYPVAWTCSADASISPLSLRTGAVSRRRNTHEK